MVSTGSTDPSSSVAVSTPSTHAELLIAGGGPAGTALIVHAAREGVLRRILDNAGPASLRSQYAELLSVVLVEGKGPDNIGCGNLGDYQIRSNTACTSFLKGVLNVPGDDKVSLREFQSLELSSFTQELLKLAPGSAPLPLVGKFMREMGREIKKILEFKAETSRVYCSTMLRELRIRKDGSVDAKMETKHQRSDGEGYSTEVKIMRCENVVLALGGSQSMPDFIKEVAQPDAKLLCSDYCLSGKGLSELRSHILATCRGESKSLDPSHSHTDTGETKNADKDDTGAGSSRGSIVIVGGSHSAFSVAWTLLSFLATGGIKVGPTTQEGPVVGGEPSSTASCSPAREVLESYRHFEHSDHKLDAVQQKHPFQCGEIIILHRSPIKLYHDSREDAIALSKKYGIKVSTTDKPDSTGVINSFSGLRGDAKRLYLEIESGLEKRIKLTMCKSSTTSNRVMSHASAIIWAGGYSANTVPIYCPEGNRVTLALDEKGQVVVDPYTGLVMTERGQVPNVYGIGLGYGMPAFRPTGKIDDKAALSYTVPASRSFARGDGVRIFQSTAARIILNHITSANKTWKKWDSRLNTAPRLGNNNGDSAVLKSPRNSHKPIRPSVTASGPPRRAATKGVIKEEEEEMRSRTNSTSSSASTKDCDSSVSKTHVFPSMTVNRSRPITASLGEVGRYMMRGRGQTENAVNSGVLPSVVGASTGRASSSWMSRRPLAGALEISGSGPSYDDLRGVDVGITPCGKTLKSKRAWK